MTRRSIDLRLGLGGRRRRARGEPVAEARAALDRPVLGGYLDGSGAACGRDALAKHLCSPNVKVNVLNVSAGGAR